MERKRFTPEQIIGMLRKAEVRFSQVEKGGLYLVLTPPHLENRGVFSVRLGMFSSASSNLSDTSVLIRYVSSGLFFIDSIRSDKSFLMCRKLSKLVCQ